MKIGLVEERSSDSINIWMSHVNLVKIVRGATENTASESTLVEANAFIFMNVKFGVSAYTLMES